MDVNINLNQLRVFHAAAKAQSFTRAAEALFLTQPGISKYIKELEEYYGVRLFERIGRRVLLTNAGEILYAKTETIFNIIGQVKIEIDELQGLNRGTLNIGASITIGIYILPDVLGRFRTMHPKIDVRLEIALNRQIADMLLDNSIDFGFLGAHVHDHRLVTTPFFEDELVLIVPGNHEWAKRDKVAPNDLMGSPFIFSGRGSGTREVIEERLDRLGIVLKNTMEFGHTEAVKKAVEAGLGISIVSKATVSREERLGVVKALHISGIDLKRTFYFAHRKERYLTSLDKAFLQFIVYHNF